MNIEIIGGSIAGLEAALRLANFGNVTVYEEHEKIGEPIKCAEGWTAFMGIDPYIDGIPIDVARIYILDRNLQPKKHFTIKTDGKVVVVDRARMEREMAKIAKELGAKIVTGKKVKISELKGEIIIDASGYPSQWCREFGNKPPGAAAIEAFTNYELDELIFCLHPEIDGYFWIFPRAVGGSNVGVGYFKKRPRDKLRALLDKFLNIWRIEALKYTGGLLGCVPNKPFLRTFNSRLVALVGDAAGLVDVFMGEGMTKAVISSRILASCIRSGKIESYEHFYFKLMRKYYLLFNMLYTLRTRFMSLAYLLGKTDLFTKILNVLSGVAKKDMQKLDLNF